MKRTIFSIAFIVCSNGVHGMEIAQSGVVKIFTHPIFPKIAVVLDDIYNRSTKNAEVTVVGEKEQIKLKHPSLIGNPRVGCMNFLCSDTRVMRRNKVFAQCFDPTYEFDHESAAIIVNGQRFIIKNPREYIEYEKIDSKLAFISEPQLFRKKFDNDKAIATSYVYRKVTDKASKSSELEIVEYTGEQALKKALEDLGGCYVWGLTYIYEYFKCDGGMISRIAFPQLGITLGIPGYSAAYEALQAVIRFATYKEHKDKYGLIELVVQTEDDFDVYKQILIGLATDKMEKEIGSEKKESCDEKL